MIKINSFKPYFSVIVQRRKERGESSGQKTGNLLTNVEG